MKIAKIDTEMAVEADTKTHDLLLAKCLAAAAAGDQNAYFDLGVAFSTGSHGTDCDLIEAHKWFNLATLMGCEAAKYYRQEISDEMDSCQISAAQRAARDWLATRH